MKYKPPVPEHKILSEKESRRRILLLAQQHGMEEAILKLFARYDELVKDCKSQEERDALGMMGVKEMHDTIFAGKGSLEVNGVLIKGRE